MEPSKMIDDSYSKRHLWINYFNILNDLFAESRLDLIHDAKTISVAMICIDLNKTYGLSLMSIYETLSLQFNGQQSGRALSNLIKLSSLTAFTSSIASIEKKALSLAKSSDNALEELVCIPNEMLLKGQLVLHLNP